MDEGKWQALSKEVEGWPRGQRSNFVTNFLRDLIVVGDIPPGERVNERVLTERLGISRTPLREAFKILEGEGLLSIRPNAGATVVRLSPEDVEDALEILIGLESIGAERAVERATPEIIEEIAELDARMREAFECRELMEYFRINQEIHQRIIDAAQNEALSRVYSSESARIRRFRFAGNRDHARWARAVAEHAQILDALRRREGPLLRELLRAHHRAGWKIARKALELPEKSP
ncbi:GntR family transcriptional regulator [Pseudotabrizicola alkalilacus]|uniref:GntR family transcriptional regulator n=1 Tax=Pseudotabrizicola alkalilacus TaxID=2305252 RepID=A0A411YWM9_9RHOB|nr:GntR family transcriptional regulator [Pseudotabrizicola alkalilacus]RGP35149.1 GntR family transcriptional regulator [Pseudotabrizicola alkalilacus]